ncbi:MAG: hypothetical protein KC431_23780, partial [Myxococcales bacterium]|nr:hypothetical protein [Myxococcales bacterium]
TADYCGTGHSYTADGTPMDWENQGGTVVPGGPGDLEAYWNANGALCLDQPRLVDPAEVDCSLPSCDDFSLDDGEWTSWLPL